MITNSTKAAQRLGVKAYELDWRIWEAAKQPVSS
jgi:hypothetical protein